MGCTDCFILMKGLSADVIFSPSIPKSPPPIPFPQEFFFPYIFSCSALISLTPCFHSPKAKYMAHSEINAKDTM